MSQARLQRLGEQLGLDARAAAIEDDIGIDMLSYEENLGNLLVSHQNDKASPMKDQYKSYPSKKMMRAKMVEADEKSKLEEWRSTGNIRPERHSRGNLCIAQTQNNDKVISNTSHLANVDMVEDDDKSKPGIFYIALWGHTFLKSSCCINGCENSDVAFHVNKEVANLVWVVEKIKFIKEKVPEEEKAEDSLKRKKCSSGDNLSSVTVPFLSYGNSGDDSQALIQESHVLVGLNRIGIDSFPVKLPYHILLENQESSYNESSQKVTPDANSIADLALDDPLPMVAKKGEVSNGVKHVVHECLVTVILLLKT
ncbi:hypothetical protein Tco_0540244 [Tanacetum coccineum]